MKSKGIIYSLVLIIIILLFAMIKICHEPKQREAFNRHPMRLDYYSYALCRMECLQLTKENIKEIMQEGIINLSKSDRSYFPCPIFALQGRLNNGQYLRVIFTQCNQVTKVLNCYDLKKDSSCSCTDDFIKK